jgi:hypothetical protein
MCFKRLLPIDMRSHMHICLMFQKDFQSSDIAGINNLIMEIKTI